MYAFICISNQYKSETDRVIRLSPRGIAPLGAQFFSAYVSQWGIAPLGAQFFSANVSLWEKNHFLTINNKKTISLISLKRYSIKLHIRAHLSGEFGGRGFKALGGVAFSNILSISM